MKLSQFKYRLPEERIAQYPCEFGPDEERPYFHRDDCRLMVVHANIFDIVGNKHNLSPVYIYLPKVYH